MIKKNSSKTILSYSTIGLQLALIMILCVYGGHKLDEYFNSSPWFVVLGTVIGMVGGIYNLINSLRHIEKSLNKEKGEKEKPKWL